MEGEEYVIMLPKGGERMRSEEELMTDEQFDTYNKLLGLVDRMMEALSEEQRDEFKKQKDAILSKMTN
jgi:hypothetical protein